MRHKSTTIILVAILFFSLLISGCITQQTTKNTENQASLSNTFDLENSEKVIVTKIIDGDTLIVQGGETVRLLGIDTPEKGEPYYSEAKNYLIDRVLFKEVYLEKGPEDRDVYKRLLRWIWFNGSLVDLEQIKLGYAISRIYEGDKYASLLKSAETQAIEQKLGLWSRLNDASQQNPAQDNSQNTQTIQLNPNSTSSPSSASSSNDCVSLGCSQGTQYVASKSSEKYHSCSCYNAKRIKPENLLCFSSKEEAEESRTLASCG